ncbi:hypothetical protein METBISCDRAFT_24394 [Metschnikowia bicuspidata]|uniref:Uncharacterized protein n=1 Tax=Metschnikowia bicuspidata TaxID=27322 RepID=A0A4P9Z954_9ASCO|nr:hypothetical protein METBISCDRAFT_24394 [Metschnikowia bicuspidata]
MFAYNTSPVYFLDALANLQQLQLLHHREQLAAQRPRILKKIETEEVFLIQIHKNSGDFESYEVRVVRAYRNPNLVNLIIESKADEFSKVFQFSLDDIEVSEIDWVYYERENVLMLNIPKKMKFCTDDFANSVLCSLLGVPTHTSRCVEGKRAMRKQRKQEKRTKRAELEASREAYLLNAVRLAEQARQEERKEAEKRRAEARKEEARKAEEARRAEEAKKADEARKEAKRQRDEEQRKMEQRRAEEKKGAEAKAEAERLRKEQIKLEHDKVIKQQQEFLNLLIGGAFTGSPFEKITDTPNAVYSIPTQRETCEKAKNVQESTPLQQAEAVAENTAEAKDVQMEVAELDHDSEDEISSDTDSIRSDVDTPPTPTKDLLYKHPSLEEVEDEEFVMFRKKFGEQNK